MFWWINPARTPEELKAEAERIKGHLKLRQCVGSVSIPSRNI
jgi:hypothetical protein